MGWVTFARDDEEVRQTAAKLAKSDLDTLCQPTAWMTDSLIDFGVQEFHGVDGANGDFHNRVLWIEPSVVKAGKDGNNEAFDNTLGAALGGHPYHLDDTDNQLPRNARVLLLPVNTGNRHWSLLAFFAATRTFVHYDSLDPSNGPAATALVERLADRGYLSRTLAVTSAQGIVRQRDGYNCGVYVIQIARKMMELGAAPAENVLQNITSNSCDQFRELMLNELRPLVGHQLPTVTIRPESLSGTVVAPLSKEELAIDALRKIKAQVAKEEPIPLVAASKCKEKEPCRVVVVLSSDDPDTEDLAAASVEVSVEDGSTVSRRATESGDKHMTGLNLRLDAKTKVKVIGRATHGAEFEEAELEEEIDLSPGEEKEVTFEFTPKEPRRFFPRLRFLDQAEDKQRPFPADFAVELTLDDGAEVRPGKTRADGMVLDDRDGAPGFRVPYRFTSLWLRFPAHEEPRRFGWTRDSEPATATFFDEDEEPQEENRRSELLPTTLWTQRPKDWEWPQQHVEGEDEEAVVSRHVDFLPDQTTLGSEDEPLTYVLKVIPQTRMMNGHPIEHVVVLMMENRGFDHVLGYLYEGSDQPKLSYPPSPQGKHASLRSFEGLEGIDPVMPYDYDYELKIPNPQYSRNPLNRAPKHIMDERNVSGKVRLRRGARGSNIPTTNPHEDFIHIIQDMYYVDAADEVLVANPHDMADADLRDEAIKSGSAYKVPQMRGWAQNFCDGICHHRGEHTTDLRANEELIHEIGDMYLPDQLPVLSGLSRHYAVSDLWFCSVPSQTNTNRAFWAAGTSAGMVKNDYYPPWHNPSFKPTAEDSLPAGENEEGIPYRRSLFHVLSENGIDSAYYASMHYLTYPNLYITTMFPKIKKEAPRLKVAWLDAFFEDLEAGELPPLSYIEPLWSGGPAWEYVGGLPRVVGNEFHPVSDMFCGEFFIKKLYDKLIASPKWDTTLFVITFDENGGTYDHFPPWEADPSGRDEGSKGPEYGFGFDCFGVRVPTLLISKYIKAGTVFRSPTAVPFDHTSVISTVLEWLEIPKKDWRLGKRVENAPTFDEVLAGSGDEEEERKKKATGMAEFDAERQKRKSGKALGAGDGFRLRYVGNKWDTPRPDELDYLGGPTTYRNYYYPIVTRDKSEALVFELEHADVPGVAGKPLDLVVAEGPAKGYRLCVPASSTSVADTVYLVKKACKQSKWAVWLVNDRVEGAELYDGDEVYLMSDVYHQDKVNTGMKGYDPWQRLTIDPYDANTPRAQRWAKFRAGKWDIWRIEKA